MNQLDNFDSNFVKATVEEWRIAAEKYQREAAQAYKKLRSYLTLYQFRLDDAQKCDIREKISETLDEIENNDGFLKDMDSYLDGFCFALDKSVLRFRKQDNDSAKHDNPLTKKPAIVNEDQSNTRLYRFGLLHSTIFSITRPIYHNRHRYTSYFILSFKLIIALLQIILLLIEKPLTSLLTSCIPLSDPNFY